MVPHLTKMDVGDGLDIATLAAGFARCSKPSPAQTIDAQPEYGPQPPRPTHAIDPRSHSSVAPSHHAD